MIWFVYLVVRGECVHGKPKSRRGSELSCECNAQNRTNQSSVMFMYLIPSAWSVQYVDILVLNLSVCDAVRGFRPRRRSRSLLLELILSLLPPTAINNPARGCQKCNCVPTTWSPGLYSLATNRKGCFVCEIRVYNLYICTLRRSPGFCSEPHWATAVLYPCNIEDSVGNYYLSNKDLKLC